MPPVWVAFFVKLKNMKINVINEHKSSVKVIILPFIQDENFENLLQKTAQDFALNFELLNQDFKAESKEIHVIYSPQNQKIICLGLGKNPNSSDVIKAFRTLFFKQKSKLPAEVTIEVNSDRKSTRLNSSHVSQSRMPSSA